MTGWQESDKTERWAGWSDGSRHEPTETTENQDKKKKLLTIRTARLETDIWFWELSKYEIGVLTDLTEVLLVENEQTQDLKQRNIGVLIKREKSYN
jgi:hypothetical protein